LDPFNSEDLLVGGWGGGGQWKVPGRGQMGINLLTVYFRLGEIQDEHNITVQAGALEGV